MRHHGDVLTVPRDKVDFVDVSPKQLVSVAAALIPFLENDDANRALMGSNMQRQAVPLVRTNAPLVGTGMESVVARDSGAAITARRTGVVDQVDAKRIVIRATEETDPTKSGVDIYTLPKFQRSNQNTCINQRPLVRVGDEVEGRRHHRRRSLDRSRRSGARAERARRLHAVERLQLRGLDPALRAHRRDDVFTSIHIEEFDVMARDTKLGPEEITRDIPNVGEEALKNLDEAGIVYIGAEVKPGDILVGKITPKGESPMTPEEKLLRAIFGEKASDVRDTSLRLPPGVSGTVVEVRVFNRHGIDKDERALAIEREEIERLAKDRDDELAILDRNSYGRLHDFLLGKQAPRRAARATRSRARSPRSISRTCRARSGGTSRSPNEKALAELEAMKQQYEESKKRLENALPRQGREAAARRRAAARRHEDGQGLRRGEAQDPAGRQDGRPARQQGRGVEDRAGRGHAVSRGRHACRHRAQSAGRAEPHECRTDPRDPSRLGLRRARPQDRRAASMPIAKPARSSRCATSSHTIYGKNEEIDALDDEQLVELAQNLRNGVPIATPVFDGAREEDIADMLKQAGLSSIRAGDAATTGAPASRSTAR